MILIGDVLEQLATLPDESVHCAVTSPPYWGLRDYGTAGQLGLEPTLDEWVSRMVAVFREVRRVLRRDGTCWLNLGDGYATGGHDGGKNSRADVDVGGWGASSTNRDQKTMRTISDGLKPKDLIGQPWRVAFALQADGWWLRSDIIWAKPNPMPESVTDRPTKSHEYMFLLTKAARYYYDADAVREEVSEGVHRQQRLTAVSEQPSAEARARAGGQNPTSQGGTGTHRNKRDVWTISTQPMPEAHFATFPEALVEPCIKAGTSERGCCAECGAPWVRVVEKRDTGQTQKMTDGWAVGPGAHGSILADDERQGENGKAVTATVTTGWQPACECGADTEPCAVLDPFMGSGTTAVVAQRLGRQWVGIELNPEYAEIAHRRIYAQADKRSLDELTAEDREQMELFK